MSQSHPFRMNWYLFALLGLSAAALHADEARARRLKSKRQNRALARLLNDYQHVKTVELKAGFVDAAIKRGRPFTDALRGQIETERQAHLKAYRALFWATIADAPRIEPTSIVDTNDQLPKRRAHLLLLREWVDKPAEQIAASRRLPAAADDETKPDRAEQLRRTEELYIKQWLSAKGLGHITSVEAALIQQVNRLRAEENVPPLQIDFQLCAAARDHSLDMTVEQFFSHKSELRNKLTYVDRALRFGTTAQSENIASCPTPGMVVSMWKASTGHKRAMLDPNVHRVGVGHVGRKYTMMFGAGLIEKTAASVAAE